jgi:hypothetical protein
MHWTGTGSMGASNDTSAHKIYELICSSIWKGIADSNLNSTVFLKVESQ